MHALNELTFFFLINLKKKLLNFLDFPDKSIDEMFMSKKTMVSDLNFMIKRKIN